MLSACGPFIVLPCSNHENSEGHSPTYAPARLKICNVPSLNISVLAQSKVGSYFRLHLGNRCSGTDGSEVPSKRMKGNPSHSPFFPICEGALKAFNAVGDIYGVRACSVLCLKIDVRHMVWEGPGILHVGRHTFHNCVSGQTSML